MGLEGIVSKRRDAPYRSGRSDNFVKTKCHGRQEFVVAGYTPSAASPLAIGALIVADHQDGELRYAGRVGTGYTQKMAHDLFKRLVALRADRRPVELPADERRKDIVWVRPKVVVEAEFAGVTHGGVLRQASFKGIREDKTASEVAREVPAAMAATAKIGPMRRTAKAASKLAKPSFKDKSAGGEGSSRQLTHPDRLYWPDVGVTKKNLAKYYVSVWDWIKPHIVDRALSLVRAPEGITGETFFQKHIAANVKSSPLRRTVPGKDRDVIAVQALDDLIALVQSAALEIMSADRGSEAWRNATASCSTSIRGREWPGRKSSSQRARRASGSRRKTSKASSSSRAAKAFMSWCRSPRLIGTRRSCLRKRSPQRWPRTVRGFISPK